MSVMLLSFSMKIHFWIINMNKIHLLIKILYFKYLFWFFCGVYQGATEDSCHLKYIFAVLDAKHISQDYKNIENFKAVCAG